MYKKNIRRAILIFILFSCLLIVFQNNPENTYAATLEKDNQELILSPTGSISQDSTNCYPGTGWRWTFGPTLPAIANRIEDELYSKNISAKVVAQSYGEEDSCGNFNLYTIDLKLNIDDSQLDRIIDQQEVLNKIRTVIEDYGIPSLGNVQVTLKRSGETILLKQDEFSSTYAEESNENFVQQVNNDQPYTNFLPLVLHNFSSPEIIRKKVYIIVYDPILSNGEYLSEYLNWWDHNQLTQETIDFFYETSGESLIYEVADFTLVNTWPTKIDGFQYTETEYLAAYQGETQYHSPDWVDYNLIVNSPLFNICEKANEGKIDEVWIYNGPGFGFYESTLVGPNAYWYNSPQVPGENTCERIIPIMGPSPERALDCAIHNFGHRMESSMLKVYGSWEQNRISHNWEKFALVDYLSPDYSYSGCGNIHYTPNSVSDYDYGNTALAYSTCEDFYNYPNLGNPSTTTEPVTCDLWGCDHLGYLRYWFLHIPSFGGCGPDSKANNWWKYFSNPELALNPSFPCE